MHEDYGWVCFPLFSCALIGVWRVCVRQLLLTHTAQLIRIPIVEFVIMQRVSRQTDGAAGWSMATNPQSQPQVFQKPGSAKFMDLTIEVPQKQEEITNPNTPTCMTTCACVSRSFS